MFRTILSITLFAFCNASCIGQNQTSAPTAKDIDRLAWLLDSWQRTNVKPGSSAFEKWEKVSESRFDGLGWSMKGNDTTFVEKLRIETKGGKLYYMANVPENPAPVYFLITEMNENGFVSQNPEHDFPKMITYQMREEELTVIISDGADKKMGFVFKKQ